MSAKSNKNKTDESKSASKRHFSAAVSDHFAVLGLIGMFMVGALLYFVPGLFDDGVDLPASSDVNVQIADEVADADSEAQLAQEVQEAEAADRAEQNLRDQSAPVALNQNGDATSQEQLAETSISSDGLSSVLAEPNTDTGLAIKVMVNNTELGVTGRTTAQMYAIWGGEGEDLIYQTEPVSVQLPTASTESNFTDLSTVTIVQGSELETAQYSYRIVVTFDDGEVFFSQPAASFIGAN